MAGIQKNAPKPFPRTFKKTLLTSAPHPGERLRLLREQSGLTIAALSRKTGISDKYLRALENIDFKIFPGETYLRGWIKKYLEAVGDADGSILSEYAANYRRVQSMARKPEREQKGRSRSTIFFELITARRVAVALAVLAAAGYLAYALADSIVPPEIILTQNFDNFQTQEESIILEGRTEPGSAVTINSRHITISENGSFSQKIQLSDGLQTILIEAKKPHSGRNRKEISIIKTPPPVYQLTQ